MFVRYLEDLIGLIKGLDGNLVMGAGSNFGKIGEWEMGR